MSETKFNDIENKRSFQVSNPAVVAGFTPFFAMMPLWMIFAFRGVTDTWRIVLIIIFVLLLGAMVAIMVNVAKKAILFVLDEDRIQVGKQEYEVHHIEQVKFNKKSKYVQLILKKGFNPSVYLKDHQEEERFINELKHWSDERGIRFEIMGKQIK